MGQKPTFLGLARRAGETKTHFTDLLGLVLAGLAHFVSARTMRRTVVLIFQASPGPGRKVRLFVQKPIHPDSELGYRAPTRHWIETAKHGPLYVPR
jgi:hypothetical protein